MSAIWGAVNLNGDAVTESEMKLLKAPFQKCVLDRVSEHAEHECYMGCGIQYFTEEAKAEELPIISQDQGICFDADVILDNRGELLKSLPIKEDSAVIPDGTLQYRMFQAFGKESLNRMLGAYAFAYYDKQRKTVSLVVDAVGNRCVYYMVQDGVLYYSSLIEALQAVKTHVEVEGAWITDFLALDNTCMITELEMTPIKGILRVAPGQIVEVSKESIKKESYWNPEQSIKTLRYKSDQEYKDRFLSLYEEAIRCVIRSKGPVSILLSGGLDSTSVACVASKILKSQNRTLYSYTSVPIKGYVSDQNKYRIVDESEDVKKTQQFLGNVKCSFIDLEGQDLWKARKHMAALFEMPYKALENALWIEEAMKRAYQNGSRIVLTGAYGNTTVSYTNTELFMKTMLRHGHFIRLAKELTMYCKKEKCSRKLVMKQLLKSSFSRKEQTEISAIYKHSYVKQGAVLKDGTNSRLKEMYTAIYKEGDSYYYDRVLTCSKRALRQIGELETKRSLMTGVIQRDPTRDKRIIEFCRDLPLDQFEKGGEERRLITHYMRPMMPEHVFKSEERGMQSADIKYRMMQQWEQTRQEWILLYTKYRANEYVDCDQAIQELNENTSGKDMSAFDIARHMYTLQCLEYMDKLHTYEKSDNKWLQTC